MKPNCHVIWELELCDCGSVNNKLFKNIVLGFMPFIERFSSTRFFVFPVCFNSHPFMDCHFVSFLIDTPKLIYASANERVHTNGCGSLDNSTNRGGAPLLGGGASPLEESWHTSITRSASRDWSVAMNEVGLDSPCKLLLKFQC